MVTSKHCHSCFTPSSTLICWVDEGEVMDLCPGCLRMAVGARLDALPDSERRRVRRQIEDRLRKSRRVLTLVAAGLIEAGEIPRPE